MQHRGAPPKPHSAAPRHSAPARLAVPQMAARIAALPINQANHVIDPANVNTSQTNPVMAASHPLDTGSSSGGGDGSTPQNPPQKREVLGSDDKDKPEQQEDQPEQEQQQQDNDGQDGESQDPDSNQQTSDDSDSTVQGEPKKSPRFSAYVHGSTMCGMALCDTPWGTIPLVTSVPLPKVAAKNGPPQFGADPETDTALQETKRRLMQGSDIETQRLAAESLVRRVNQGDQNAMAMIQMIGVNARAGDEKAKQSVVFITRYVNQFPKGSEGTIHGEMPHRHVLRGAVRLADGPPLTNHRIREIASTFGGKHTRHRKLVLRSAASFGADSGLDPSRLDQLEKRLYELGQCVGLALGIQCVRAGGPIEKLSQRAAWELGK